MADNELSELRERRAKDPTTIAHAAKARKRRPFLDESGRIFILAADHPARAVLAAGDDPFAMADRNEMLARLVTALARPGVDGVLATPDVIEDLLLLGVLEHKVVLGSMNRGGLRGADFEMDDRFTAYDAARIVDSNLDGGKMLCRIDLADAASVTTLESCARAVTELAERHLVAMIEPFISRREQGRVVNDLSADAVMAAAGIASALGSTSAWTWLKLPVCDRVEEMKRVVASTTLPIVLLGGDARGPAGEMFQRWETVLALPGVRGVVAGRTLLYPPDGDVEAAVDAAAAIVRPHLRSATS
jgi:DhnA family fructose-bisphosphate aldolase class Ia